MAWRPWDNFSIDKLLINKPKIIGHRGCAGLFPENSLAACRHAIELGLDGLEIDVQLSADDEIIVYHDLTINHAYSRHNGIWLDEDGKAIKDLTYSELSLYNIGMTRPKSTYRRRRRGQVRLDHEVIPTLQQVFSLIQNTASPTFCLWLEIKTHPLRPDLSADPIELTRKVIDLVKRFDTCNKVIIMSFDWRCLGYIRAHHPSLQCAFLTCEDKDDDTIGRHSNIASPWLGGYNLHNHNGSLPHLIKAAGGHYWAPFYQDITYRDIIMAHELGLQVYVWTVNQRTIMQRLTRWGVDGMITDYPNRW